MSGAGNDNYKWTYGVRLIANVEDRISAGRAVSDAAFVTAETLGLCGASLVSERAEHARSRAWRAPYRR